MNDDMDLQMHNCMTVIWAAYRTGNVEKFNKTFADLYAKYQDETVQQFIKGMGWALSSAINKKNGVIK